MNIYVRKCFLISALFSDINIHKTGPADYFKHRPWLKMRSCRHRIRSKDAKHNDFITNRLHKCIILALKIDEYA